MMSCVLNLSQVIAVVCITVTCFIFVKSYVVDNLDLSPLKVPNLNIEQLQLRTAANGTGIITKKFYDRNFTYDLIIF